MEYGSKPCMLAPSQSVNVQLEGDKRLLLLDMDETLLHAATINDIYVHKVYGPHPRPDFFTAFHD